MDYQSVKKFQGMRVRLTLINNFWYRCNVLSVSEKVVEFIEEKGKKLSVSPEAILMIEEVERKRFLNDDR